MKMKRIISLVIVLLLVCGMPVSAFAETWYVDEGDITVNATESGQTVTQGTQVDVPDSAPVITQHDSSTPTDNTVTISADENATANVTLDGVNIDTSGIEKAAVEIKGNGDVVIELDGSNTVQSGYLHAGVEKNTTAATETEPANGTGKLTITDENETHGSLKATGGGFGAGIGGGDTGSGSDITITGSAEVTAQGGVDGAGIGGGEHGNGSNITIEGSAEVTAQGKDGGSGIGGGASGSGSNITITGSAEVTAKGDISGSGIGGGYRSTGSNITVSEDAQVKVQGGKGYHSASDTIGTGAAIGNGGKNSGSSPDNIAGNEVKPKTDALTTKGKIEYYAPGADMENDNPIMTVTGTYVPPQDEEKTDRPSQSAAEGACYAPLYRVIGQDGKAIDCKAMEKDGVLTVTVDADFASLTGSLGGINALKEQGIDTIVFVTNGASSTFALSDLMAQGSSGDSYTLTHNGDTVSFTLSSGADLGNILK